MSKSKTKKVDPSAERKDDKKDTQKEKTDISEKDQNGGTNDEVSNPAPDLKNDNIRPKFRKIDNAGNKLERSILYAQKDESWDEAYKRLGPENKKWFSDEDQIHASPNKRELHKGDPETCELGNCRLVRNQKIKDEEKQLFIHRQLHSLEDVANMWKNVPSGRMPVFFYGLVSPTGNGLHVTLIYRECGPNFAGALFTAASESIGRLKKRHRQVTIAGDAGFHSELYPDSNIYGVNLTLDRTTRSLVDKLSVRKWIPHITDTSGELKEGDVLELEPQIQVLYVKISELKFNENSMHTFFEPLKLRSVSGTTVPNKKAKSEENPHGMVSKPEIEETDASGKPD